MARKYRSTDEAAAALTRATKEWKAAKRGERAARDRLATVVSYVVDAGLLNESKVAKLTAIPRMTIRKMLGKQ